MIQVYQTDIPKQALSSFPYKITDAHRKFVCDHIISNTNDIQRAMLSHCIGIDNRHPDVFISQRALAAKQNRKSRRTALRAMKHMHEQGIIIKETRPFKTCLYRFPYIYSDRKFRWMLDRFIKSFNFLKITLLLVAGLYDSPFVKNPYIYAHKELLEENVTQRDNRILYIRYDSTPKDRVSGSGHSPGPSESHRSGIKPQDPRRGMPMRGDKRIKTLKLTRAGEIKVSPFPQAARDYADNQLRLQKKPVQDLFRFYCMLCKDYCTKNNITPEWRSMFSMLTKEGFQNDAPGINPKDPYEYEFLMPKSMDPTAHFPQSHTSDNAPKHSIYATAQAPHAKEPESRATLESNCAKLEALRSGEDPYLAFFASQMADMMKFVKTVD